MSPRSAPCSTGCSITATCSSVGLEAGAPRPHRHRKERNSLYLGTPSPNPWDLSLSRQNGCGVGRLAPPPFRPWIGALVASLRCPILRPGLARISPFRLDCEKCLPKRPSAGYKYSCSGSVPLAGFEVATYGRFSGGRRGLVSNLETAEPLWFGRERKKETLDQFFQDHLSLGQRRRIEAACVDMWEAYRQSIEEWAPRCRIVYDKFHILQHANAAVDEVRRAEFFRQGVKKRGLIKGKRWLLLSRWRNLDSQHRGELNR